MHYLTLSRATLLVIPILTISVVFNSSTCPAAAIPHTAIGIEKHEIQHDGRTRSFYLHLPAAASRDRSRPLVMILHGGGRSDGAGVARRLGFNELADREGFIAVYPNGVDAQWNDGRGVSFRKNKDNAEVDDVGFLSTLIDHLITTQRVDPKRIYVCGASNGGMMSHRLGSEIASKIAAIAAVISNLPENVARRATPNAALPVLVINGTADPFVPWNGGKVTISRKTYGSVRSTVETIRFWCDHNEFHGTPTVVRLPDVDPNDGSWVEVHNFANEQPAAPVVLYKIHNGGHTLPGMKTPPRARHVIGNANQDISATEVIWEFFEQHTRDMQAHRR